MRPLRDEVPSPGAEVTYRRSSGVVHRTFRGATEVLAPDDAVTRLDGAASAVWATLDRERTCVEIVEAIERMFGTTVDLAVVREALDLIESAGVAEAVAVPGP